MPKAKSKIVEIETDPRDFTMARILAARSAAQSAITFLDEAAVHFLDTQDDPKGKERKRALDDAAELLGEASRAVEGAQAGLEDMDKDDLLAEEPDPDADSDEGNGDEEEDDEDEEEDED